MALLVTNKGVLGENIQIWNNNGIEYYYPKKHVAIAFKCDESELLEVNLGAEPITVKSISMSKIDLANKVVSSVTVDDQVDVEICGFLEKVKQAIA